MRFLLSFIFILSVSFLNGQELPLGYTKYYENYFSSKHIDTNLIFSHTTKAKITDGKLNLSYEQDTLDGFLPGISAVLNYNVFGEYIAELRLKGKITLPDSTSGLYLIIGLRDSLNYYYIRMDNHATSFYKSYKGEKSLIANDSSMTLSDNYFILRIERDILTRQIVLKKDDSKATFTDPNLVMGYFGFGADKCSFFLDRIIIWAPTSIEKPAPLFQ